MNAGRTRSSGRSATSSTGTYGKTENMAIAASGIEITVDDEKSNSPTCSSASIARRNRAAERLAASGSASRSRSIAHARGGELRLANRAEGGLRAKIVLLGDRIAVVKLRPT
jgi:hypothetical protein